MLYNVFKIVTGSKQHNRFFIYTKIHTKQISKILVVR